jgi:hypothetical protein
MSAWLSQNETAEDKRMSGQASATPPPAGIDSGAEIGKAWVIYLRVKGAR